MSQKRKCLLAILLVIVLVRAVYVYIPAQAVIVFDDYAGTSFEEPLTNTEVRAFRKAVWGKLPLPEWLTGIPACGFGKGLSIVMGNKRYMLAWDSCGTLCVMDAVSDSEDYHYLEISDRQRAVIKEMFDSRIQRVRSEQKGT